MHLSVVWKGLKKKKKVTMIHQSYLGVRRMYVLSLKKNQTKILPWLQGPPLHTPLLVVDVDSPEPSKLARAGAEWAGGQRGREFTGNFKKKQKKEKKLKKSFYCIFVIHTNALLYIIFFIP